MTTLLLIALIGFVMYAFPFIPLCIAPFRQNGVVHV